MLGHWAADTAAKRQVLDPQTLYGAFHLQSHGVRGQAWQQLPQDPERGLIPEQNTANMRPYRQVQQAAPQTSQRSLLGRIRSRYTFLPVGRANQAPQSSA